MTDARSGTTLNPQSWPVIRNRTVYLTTLAQGLEVLDIGCTGRKGSGRLPDCASTLHHEIRPVCASLTGLDIDAEGIEVMRTAGYRAVCGDVSSTSLDQRCDVIIAAEVIEHLPNPALTGLLARTCLFFFACGYSRAYNEKNFYGGMRYGDA